MTDHQAPTIDQILAMKSGELHEWSRRGHTVVTPFGLGTVYNETFLATTKRSWTISSTACACSWKTALKRSIRVSTAGKQGTNT